MSEDLTRTVETEDDYERRARQLIARLSREIATEHGRVWRPSDLVAYLAELQPTLAHASWRHYKASLVWVAGQRAVLDPAWLGVAERLSALTWSSKALTQPLPMRTSARKLKDVFAADLLNLRDHLSFVDPLTAAFVTAAWTTGLRPTEWTRAKLEMSADRWRLQVWNAKRTNGRSHGVNRTLWFSMLDFKRVTAIRDVIAAFGEASDRNRIDALKERFERAFRGANQVLWPRRKMKITPYTLRHACGARLKATYTSAEVAALMGHRSDLTAYTHYGRFHEAKGGGLPPLPKADPADVANVRLDKDANLQRLAKAKMKPATIAGSEMESDEPSCIAPRM